MTKKNERDQKKDQEEVIEAEVVEDLEENKEDQNAKENSGDDVKQEDKDLKDQIQRLQADFINFKNRSEKEKEDVVKFASKSLILKLLPVIDNFERALDANKKAKGKDFEVSENKESKEKNINEEVKKIEDGNDLAFMEGVEMIKDQLYKVLKEEGLDLIESDGKEFNADFHHAVFMEEREGVESGIILETFQKGYTLNGRVIRPAMVKVAK